MSQRNRFARAGAVAGAFVLAVAMTPPIEASTRGGSSGGSRGGGSTSSHSTSSGGSRSSSGGHTVTSSGPRSSPNRDGARGGYSPRSGGGIRGERGGRGGWYGGGWGGRGSWGGGHSYWGGHYYPRWYGDWYWGFTPYWASYGWLWGWPWYYDPFWTDWRFVQIYGDGGYGYYGGGDGWRSTAGPWASHFGRVKTDVEPDEAELYLNGKYIGTADDFDGHPDYLYLESGTYKIEFRLNGYQTWTDDLTIRKGEVVRMRHELDRDKGHGRLDSFLPHPKEMPSGRFFDASGNPVSPNVGRSRHTARATGDEEGPMGIDDRKDRDRPRTDVEADSDDDRPLGGAAPAPDARSWDRERDRVRDATPATPARARLRWKVTPEDAAVWVDDQYLGTADELSARPRGTMLQPGKHTVTVVRPGFKSRTVEVVAKSGEAVDVIVELEK